MFTCYTKHMRLIDVLENCHLDRALLDESVINTTIMANYDSGELVRVIEIFLRGIGKHHSVPGKVIESFWGISDWYREHRSLTAKQQVFVIQNLIRYWDQINLEMRSTIL